MEAMASLRNIGECTTKVVAIVGDYLQGCHDAAVEACAEHLESEADECEAMTKNGLDLGDDYAAQAYMLRKQAVQLRALKVSK